METKPKLETLNAQVELLKKLFASNEERFQRIAEAIGSLREEVASMSAQPAGSGMGRENTGAFFDELGRMNAKTDALSAKIASNDELFNAILWQLKQTKEKTSSDYEAAFAGVEGELSAIRNDLGSIAARTNQNAIAARMADKLSLPTSAQKELEKRIGSMEREALKQSDLDALKGDIEGRLEAGTWCKLKEIEQSTADVRVRIDELTKTRVKLKQSDLDALKSDIEGRLEAGTWRKLREIEQSTADVRVRIDELTKTRANANNADQQTTPQIYEPWQTAESPQIFCPEIEKSKSQPVDLQKGAAAHAALQGEDTAFNGAVELPGPALKPGTKKEGHPD